MLKISRLAPKKLVVIGVLVLVFGLGVFGAVALAFDPVVTVAAPAPGQTLGLAADLTLTFSLPTSRRDLSYVITPEIEGSWHWQGGLVAGRMARQLVFSPDGYWEPDRTYEVKVTGITGVLSANSTSDWSGQFQTSSLPTIVSAAAITNDQPVDPVTPIEVKLDQPNDGIAEFSFSLDPPAQLAVELSADQSSYSLQPVEPLRLGVTYTLVANRQLLTFSRATQTVVERGAVEEVWRQSFTTIAGPTVETFEPQGDDVLPNISVLAIQFREPMATDPIDQQVQVRPSVSGVWQWEGDKRLVLKPTADLTIATSYEIVLGLEVKTASGVALTEPISLGFKTVGEVVARSVSPGNRSGVGIDSTVSLTFNQPVDHDSAESRFSISPTVDGRFSWSGNRLNFQPTSPLAYYQTLTVNLSAGVKAIYGLDSTRSINFQFTTEERTVLLNVAFDRQDRALSCEAAALKMALRYRGVNVSEGDIMNQIGYDPTPRGSNTWGDPDVAFVGSIDGAQNSTGYGVHWSPIANAARVWRSAEAFSGWSVQDLARQIEAGNPVVVWGVTGTAYVDPWQTPDGRTINAWKGEHARTVIGWRGSADNPSSFIINDPLAGRVTWSVSRFQSDWAKFSQSGVVVY